MQEYILEIKKLIPQNFCEKIISYFDKDYDDAGTVSGVNKNIRNCLTRSVLDTKTFGEKLCSNATKEVIFNCVSQYTKKFNRVQIEKISQLDILKYESNNFDAGYHFHTDFGYKCTERALSNDFEGGEFVFDLPSGEFCVPQNIGDAIIFPSNFMFPHQVNKVKKGTRYALIGWVV